MVIVHEWHRWELVTPPAPEPPPPPPPPVDPSSWTILAGGGPGRVAGVIGGKIYAAGAFSPPTANAYVYDPATNTWTARQAMPSALAASVGGVIADRLHVVTGYTGSTRQAVHYVYDPATNTWSTAAPIPTARDNACGAVVGGKLYVAGGSSTSATLASVDVYDPATNSWSAAAPLPSGRSSACAAGLNGKLYVAGGSGAGVPAGVALQLVEYDPATNTWTQRAPLPSSASSSSLCAVGGRLYLTGRGGAETWRWNPDTNTWTQLVNLPAAKSSHWSVNLAGVLHVGGGSSNSLYAYAAPDFDPDPDPDPVPEPSWEWVLDEDRSAGLMSWSITYGRTDYTARVNALTATVGLAGFYAAPCPASGERFRLALSEEIATELGLTDAERVRFSGEVTDPVIDPRNPVSDVYTITAAGRLGRFRRRSVDGHTWPQEKDGARVARILEAAGGDAESAGVVDVGTRPLIPPVRKVSAGQLLDQTSDSTGGQLVEQLTGALDWHSGEHRRGVPSTVTLAAAEILNDLTFEQHVGDLVNRLELSYGRADQTVTVRDAASIDARDVYEATLSTALANAIDAHDLGLELVGRRSEPVWQLPNLVVDLRRAVTSSAKRAQLLALRFGDRITVTGLPAGAPYAGAVELYVEGITETATPRAWRLSISVSDPLLSGVGLRWIDVPDGVTWDDIDPTLTWLDLARIENPDDLV